MDSLWSNIFSGRRREGRPAVDILREVPLFEGLKDRELAHVAGLMHARSYSPEEVVFGQGVPGFGMYFIESGAVNIVHEPTGRVLAELKEGDFFGELALLANIPRSAAAVAAEPSRLYGFFHSDLTSLIEHNPKMGVRIAFRLAAIIGERLITANEQVMALQAKLDAMVITDEPG